jgi:hypothetical protein
MDTEEAAEMRAWKLRNEVEKVKYLLVALALIGVAACLLLWQILEKLPD